MSKPSRSRALSFSSEKAVVPRWFGGEILDHSPSSVRMEFMNSGRAPLLLYHDQRQQVGIIEKANIGADKIGHATARFGRSSAAEDALTNVDDGIFVNTSVGYRVHEMVLDRIDGDEEIYRVTDWEPYEGSLVGVPADMNVGVGRSVDKSTTSSEVATVPVVASTTARTAATTAAKPAITGEKQMADGENAAAGSNADVNASGGDSPAKISAVQAERERRQAIIDTCKANKLDSRIEARWIMDGIPLTQVAKEVLDVMEERGKQKPMGVGEAGLSASETRRYSLFKAIRALRYGANDPRFWNEAGFERECSMAVAKKLNRETGSSIFVPAEILMRPMATDLMSRALATTPGSKGGALVQVDNFGFIDILRNRSVAIALGARQLSGLVGNVMFPRQTGKASVTWQAGEGTSVTAGDQALGQLSMTPKTAIAITDVSEQLLRQSSISAEQFVMADLAAVLAIDGVDNKAINGAGGAEPLGVKNTTGITSGQDSASATYAKILAFVSTAGAANAIRGNPGFVTNTAGAAKLMTVQRFTSTDTPVWTGNMLDGELVSFRARSSEQLASGNLIFGSWDELVIGDWGVLELSTDNGGTRFNQAQVGIRALWMVDILLRYPQAFVVSTNLS